MLSDREVSAAIGTTAVDADGGKIGTVEHFFVDDRTGAPTWVAVTTGLFGTRHSVVPVHGASFTGGRLVLPVSRDAVRSAPDAGSGGHLDPDDEARLRRHYGLAVPGTDEQGWTAAEETRPNSGGVPAGVGPTAGPQPGAAADEAAMTRSEERLRTGTEQVAARRVRLVKYVVTEEVQLTVPIRREEIRLEEVPLDAPDAGHGESLVPAGTAGDRNGVDEGREIVLHTERPVVSVEVVPTERVRLRTELVEGSEQVTEQVQREQIVVDTDRRPGAAG